MTKPKSNKSAFGGRGGYRENSGRPAKVWVNKSTTAVRVPKVHLEAILKYAHDLDTESISSTVQNQTNLSQVIQSWLAKVEGKEKSPRWENASKLLQELQSITVKNT